jgi:hypothetical protein
MKRLLYTGIISFLIFLAACLPANQTATELPEVVPLTETPEGESSPSEEVLPTEASSAPSSPTDEPVIFGEPMAGCTVVSLIPEANPTEVSLFPSIGDSDWVKGPESAAVTIVEYGDFQ